MFLQISYENDSFIDRVRDFKQSVLIEWQYVYESCSSTLIEQLFLLLIMWYTV